MNAIIPKFLIEEEDIIALKDKGISIQEGLQTVTNYKIPCYKFYNIDEISVFNELQGNKLYEATSESEKISFANRMASILFLRIRQAAQIKDKDTKVQAACSLCAAVNSLAEINMNYAKRFLPLIRGLI